MTDPTDADATARTDAADQSTTTDQPGSAARTAGPDVADPALEAIVRADALDDVLDAAGVVVDECIVDVTPGGVAITAIDPATVGMVDLELDADAFQQYDATDARFGVDLDRLRDVVGMARGDDVVELVVDAETRTLHVRIGELAYRLALVDPDAVRSPPDTVAIADELDAAVTVDGDAIARAIDAAEMVGRTLTVGVDTDAHVLYARADGDADAVDFARHADDCERFDAAPADSLYSVDYLAALTRVLPDDAPVDLELDEDAPIAFGYDVAEGHGRVRLLVAPRLSRN